MNLLAKKSALVTLIKNSISFASEAKLALLSHVRDMTEEEVERLGKYLATERSFVLENEERILGYSSELVSALLPIQPQNPVYYATAKP